jgi:fucose 4-O-acetylase-like acetyltransferase
MRQYRLDQAKFALIVLVVLGHLLEQVKSGSAAMETLYRFLYLFHMPAFAYLSGVVSSATFDMKAGKRWLATLVLPYLVFQAAYLFVDAKVTHGAFIYRVAQPYWVMWYLLSLASWRLLLPAVLAVRWPIAVTGVAALLVGLLPDVGYGFSLSRTFVFLPFFVAGHVLGGRVSGPRWATAAAFAALLVIACLFRTSSPLWVYGSVGYGELKVSALPGMAIRAGLLITGGIGCWAVMRLVPERDGVTAEAGRNSLAVYLLHGLAIKLLAAAGSFALLMRWPWLVVAIAPLSVFALAWLGRRLRPVMDYRWLWQGPRGDTASTPHRS